MTVIDRRHLLAAFPMLWMAARAGRCRRSRAT